MIFTAFIGLIFTACVSGTEIRTEGTQVDEQSSALALNAVQGDFLEAAEVIEEKVQEPTVFEHPLLGTFVQSLVMTYGQWAPGEAFLTDRDLKVIFKDPVKVPELIMVNEQAQVVKRVQGTLAVKETPASWVFSVEDLAPGATYVYSIRDGEAFSEIRELTMPVDDGIYDFLVFGDLQGYKESQYRLYGEILTQVDEVFDPAGIFFLGDVVDIGSEVDQWTYYMTATEELAWKKAMASPVGNHDVKGGRDWYNRLFTNNAALVFENQVAAGYTVLPDAVIAVIDTEKTSLYGEQMAWLAALMEANDKPYKIVMMHRSPYPIFYEEPHVQQWAKTFESLGIDLVLSGHDHIYSRTEMQGTHYVVGGSGSGSKYYGQSEVRPWQEVVYDENNPVHLRMSISAESLALKAYAYVDSAFIEVDALEIHP